MRRNEKVARLASTHCAVIHCAPTDLERACNLLRAESIRYELLMYGCVRLERRALPLLDRIRVDAREVDYRQYVADTPEGRALRSSHLRDLETMYGVIVTRFPG